MIMIMVIVAMNKLYRQITDADDGGIYRQTDRQMVG